MVMATNGFWAGLLGTVLTAVGCAHAQKPQDGAPDPTRRPAYVDAAKAPATVRAGEKLEVVIEGNLPDPAWELLDVEVQRGDHQVLLTPWIRRKHTGPTMQVLVPFERVVPVEGLAPGKWTIEVRGHGDTSEKVTVDVTP
jgi:hypothetical protein